MPLLGCPKRAARLSNWKSTIAVFALASTAPVSTHADCLDYGGDYPHLIDTIWFGSQLTAFHVTEDGLAYVGSRWEGNGFVSVYDLTSPEAPASIGSVSIAGPPSEIDVTGALMCVVSDGGLEVFDVTNPATPVLLGSETSMLAASGVSVEGSIAYVSDRDSGLHVVDLTDPSAPAHLGSVAMPSEAYHVDGSGDYAFVADRLGGLVVVDASDGTSPVVIGNVPTPDECWGVLVADDIAYVSAAVAGVQIVDVSTPSAPALLTTVDTQGRPRRFQLDGTDLYVCDRWFGLTVLDVSDPAAADVSAAIAGPGWFMDVGVWSGVGYLTYAEYDGALFLYDVASPVSPEVVGTLDTPGSTRGVAIAGDLAYIGDGNGGLFSVDISDPTTPVFEGSLSLPYARQVALHGNVAYVGDLDAVHVVDISDPSALVLVTSVATPDFVWGMAVHETSLLVAADEAGLLIFDISDPHDPTLVRAVATTLYSWDVAVNGDYAYVAGRYLAVVDISTPSSAFLVTETTPTIGEGIAISGDRAYVSGSSRLHVVDISSPASPTWLGSLTTQSVEDVVVMDEYAFVTTNGSGVQVVNVADPFNLELVANIGTTGELVGIAVAGEHLAVANGVNGLRILPGHCGAVVSVPEGVTATVLDPLRIRPNPGRSSFTLTFEQNQRARTVVTVHDAAGRLVRELFDAELTAGTHTMSWDGRNDAERVAAPGVYFVQVESVAGPSGVESHRQRVVLVP